QVENIVSNCGLPVGPHNLAFIPTPTIGSQDCDLTILLKDEKSPVWDYRRILRTGLRERYPGTEFTFQPSDLTAKILNFGAPAPIDVQVNGPDVYPSYEFARTLEGKLREIPVDASSNSSNGKEVQLLGNLANISAERTPGVVTHGNIMPLFNIYVSAEGRDLGGVLADVEKVAHSMEHELPRSAALEIHGQAALMYDAYAELIFGLLAAIVLVYLLIVVNFQSWLDPFIIITALPGALAGI